MAYSMEVVKRARDRLAQAKEDRESENRQHLAEAYDRVPRIREIDGLLRRSMAIAMQTVFQTGSDAKAAMEAVKDLPEPAGPVRKNAARGPPPSPVAA